MQGLMIGAIVAAALLIGLLAACCCLCACLPACRTPPPKPAPLTYRPVARPRQLMRRYIIDGYEERWIPEERRIVEEDVVIEEPVEETREHYYLESSRYSDVESGEEADETQRLNLLRNVLHRTSRNPFICNETKVMYIHRVAQERQNSLGRILQTDRSMDETELNETEEPIKQQLLKPSTNTVEF
ncbi:hypothetical protein BSL78_26978 [Apostichopus japonicus]|uniref:Uncharacterized protein n=1 Tax=Stichopus japonicus TaxID=307972 RepID=A0A2G8JKD9_STIJA|nr:hypothetical protein BSL78_26978 [Apostichopus japonicus]